MEPRKILSLITNMSTEIQSEQGQSMLSVVNKKYPFMEVIHRGATGDRAPGNVEKELKNAIAGAQIQDEKMVEETVAYWDPTGNQEIATDIDARLMEVIPIGADGLSAM